MSEHEHPSELPRVAVDRGDHIEVQRSAAARSVGLLTALATIAVGVVVLVLAPGELAQTLPFRIVVGGGSVAIGLVALVWARRGLILDREGATLRGILGSRSLSWSYIAQVRIEEGASRTTPGPPRASRRFGGLTVRTGGKSGRSRRSGGLAGRDHRAVSVRLRSDEDRDVTMLLDGAEVREGEALVGVLRQRTWLPHDTAVRVEMDP
jgi:hypothetical protein